jgi:hypothetical protein
MARRDATRQGPYAKQHAGLPDFLLKKPASERRLSPIEEMSEGGSGDENFGAGEGEGGRDRGLIRNNENLKGEFGGVESGISEENVNDESGLNKESSGFGDDNDGGK